MRGVFLRSVLAGCLLLSQALSATACYYPSASYSYAYAAPTYYTPYVQKEVVVKKVVAVEYLAVPVVAPVYAVGYAAPVAPAAPAAPAAAPCTDEVKSLRAELEKLKAALGAPPVQPQHAPQGRQSAFVLKCAGCHDAEFSKAKGGKLTMFEHGVALQLSPEVANEAVRQILAGKMPRNGKLSPEEVNAILDEVLTLSARKRE